MYIISVSFMANISFLLNQFPSGGVERVTINLIPHLVERGHRIFIFVHRLYKQHLTEELPVTYIPIPHEPWREENGEEIEKAVKEYKIDLFFAPIVSPEYIFRLKKSNLCKVCYVSHGAPFYELKESAYACHQQRQHIRKRLKRFKQFVVDRLHLKYGLYRKELEARYKRRHDELDAYGVLYEKYGEIIAERIGVDYTNSKFFALPNPFPQIENIELLSQRKKRILYVGRLSYVDKRVDRLLRVWEVVYKRFPEWELTIIGDGPEKESLQNYVEKNNLPRVEFIPFTPTPELYYKTSEILCLTSDFEGFGMVLLEAQQFGCATMAFDCSYGVRDILSPNWENGVYVPNGEINTYARALSRLMGDETLRHKIQLNGIENVKRFSIERSVEQYDTLIRKLCFK